MKKIKKYRMCESQLAQIDCRRDDCLFQQKGHCGNISPAISLQPGGTVTCWSYENETTMKDEA